MDTKYVCVIKMFLNLFGNIFAGKQILFQQQENIDRKPVAKPARQFSHSLQIFLCLLSL